MAATHNIKASRVSEVIEMTGLAGVATKRVGGYSLVHGPAPRHRRRPHRRPQDAHPRRAGQRSRPRGRAVGPPARARPGRRRTTVFLSSHFSASSRCEGSRPSGGSVSLLASGRGLSPGLVQLGTPPSILIRKVLPSPPAGRGQPRTSDRGPCKRQVVGSIPTGGSLPAGRRLHRSTVPPRAVMASGGGVVVNFCPGLSDAGSFPRGEAAAMGSG